MFDSNRYNKKRNLEQKPTKEEYENFKRQAIGMGIMGAIFIIILLSFILPNWDLIVDIITKRD